MDNFFMPARVIYGEGALKTSGDILSSLGRACLIVTGGSSAKASGALDDALKVLADNNITYSVFDEISANPLVSVCHKAGAAARECGAQFILGIGGGSVLDSAKAIAIYAANPSLKPMDIYKREYDNEPLKVVLCGTTSGTGSEVTGVSVLTNNETGIKKSISGPDCYAAVSLCDPTYTHSMPYKVTVSTALDAFAHAVEGWFTPKSNNVIDLYASKCIPDIFNALCNFYETGALPDGRMRDKLYAGSLYAGLVINTCGTAFPHPLGYILTENYGVPHGAACAAFFPAFLDRCMKFNSEKADRLFTLCGAEPDTIKEVVRKLSGVDIKITPEQAENYSGRWEKAVPKNFTASPGGLTREEAVKILTTF